MVREFVAAARHQVCDRRAEVMKSAISWLDRCVCGVHELLNERGWCQGWLVIIIDEVVRDGGKEIGVSTYARWQFRRGRVGCSVGDLMAMSPALRMA